MRAKAMYSLKQLGLVLLFVVTIVIMGSLFTSIRTNAIDSKSFEASPLQTYSIESLEELNE